MQSLWIVSRQNLKPSLETADAYNEFVLPEMITKLLQGSCACISPPNPLSHSVCPILIVLLSLLLPGRLINSPSASLLMLYRKHISDEEHDHQYSSSGNWGINIHGGRASKQIHPAAGITVGGREGHARAFRPLFIRGPVQASIDKRNCLQWQPLFTLYHFSGRCTQRDKQRETVSGSSCRKGITIQTMQALTVSQVI